MADEDGKLELAQSVRHLSTNIDAAALELGSSLDNTLTAQLKALSVRLSNMADAIEDPSLVEPGEIGRAGADHAMARLH